MRTLSRQPPASLNKSVCHLVAAGNAAFTCLLLRDYQLLICRSRQLLSATHLPEPEGPAPPPESPLPVRLAQVHARHAFRAAWELHRRLNSTASQHSSIAQHHSTVSQHSTVAISFVSLPIRINTSAPCIPGGLSAAHTFTKHSVTARQHKSAPLHSLTAQHSCSQL